ncbi:MAG: hypothetical protein GY796_11185 [Chloroflexi bacterium]|nr:hypothetical protein [Chloroflexota bacterium]
MTTDNGRRTTDYRLRITDYRLRITNHGTPWLITAVLLLILLLLILFARWRSTSTGAQVQVPMFYDAHYLFPRPWTQAQEAPGIPTPFPIAIYGPNNISQPFVSGSNDLAMVEIWLAGSRDTAVTATLTGDDSTTYTTDIPLAHGSKGGFYRLAFPQIPTAENRPFVLTLSAPEATAAQPAITHAVGGDKLGGAIRLNEYGRPGNLQLTSYVRGTAVLDALTEQLLPDLFRLRLQQYKVIKGEWFAVLFAVMAGLSGVYLVLARPSGQSLSQAVGWTLTGLLAGFLIWQVGDGRVRLPLIHPTLTMQETAAHVIIPDTHNLRVVNDITLAIWTANREPDERFVQTAIAGQPAIVVPADSVLTYALDVPHNGRFHTAVAAKGQGEMRFTILFNDQELASQTVIAGEQPIKLDVDLAALAGQGGRLQLLTKPISGEPEGYWFQPQLLAQADWLLTDLPPQAQPAGHQIGEDISLLGYAVEPVDGEMVRVTLYWQTTRPLTQNATVFVHLLDENGNLLAQDDSQPVANSYPLTVWPTNIIIADEHMLPLTKAPAALAVGLYNPHDFTRWPVKNADGEVDVDGRVLLSIKE